jgi:hypothetical protein
MLSSQFEVAARGGAIYQIAASPVRDLTEVGGGVSYYIAGHSHKLQAEYFRIFHDTFDGGVNAVRVQFMFQP